MRARADRVRAAYECDLRRRLGQARAVHRGEEVRGRWARGGWEGRERGELRGLRERMDERTACQHGGERGCEGACVQDV